MSQKILFFIATLFFFHASFSQVTIRGKVIDNKGKPLPGASVTLKDTYDGALVDSMGNYVFTTKEQGSHQLIYSLMGYHSVEQAVMIGKENITINISLKEELNELKAVIISAGSFAAGDNKRGTVLNSIDIATTAGSNADITAALKTLPGAQQVGEKDGLYVRGGEGYETKQFIDGTMVNDPYFSSVPDIASRGRFSPFLFKGTVFSTGGYSALYGQALSSAVILESIDLPEKSAANAAISPLFVGAGFQDLAKNKKSSWGANYGYVNVNLYFNLVKQTPDYFKIPEFHNADANFRIKTKSGGIIKYYTTFDYSEIGIRRPDIDSNYLKNAFSITNHNWYNNLSWRENLGNGWEMNLGTSYSTNRDDIGQQVQDANNQPRTFDTSTYWMNAKNFHLKNRQDLSQIKLVLKKKLGGISTLRFGGEYWYNYNSTQFNDTTHLLNGNYQALFAESDIYLTNDIVAQVGARFEHASIINKLNIAPRVSLAYRTGPDAQISLAYGMFYQTPETQQLFYSTQLGFIKATHYILNYQKMTNLRTFRAEIFYKKYQDLIKTYPTYDNSGYGYAKGVEVFYRDKKTFKGIDYWISYSYLDTKRDYLNFPLEMEPNFAAHHTASFVLKKFYTSLKTGFNLTYTFATGRPYYNFQLNNGKYEIADQGITKDYNSLGFSVNYLPNLGKQNARTFLVLFASVNNVLGADQVYGYNYSYNGSLKQAITPPAKRMYFIGLFLSWGVDRSQDAINNNL
ncbi:MAG: TonB-dependent receptor [Bacteroidetes bacterium]|nr:TonB-dependent receptor [Bacteroidota bacterium]